MTEKRWAEAFIHSIMPASALLVFLLPAYWDAGGASCTPLKGTWGSLDWLLRPMRKEAEKWRAGPVTSVVLPAQLLLLAPRRLRCWRFIGQILKVQCAILSVVACCSKIEMLDGHILLLTPLMGPWLMMMKKRLGSWVVCGCWTREEFGVIQYVNRQWGCGLLLRWALDWWWWKKDWDHGWYVDAGPEKSLGWSSMLTGNGGAG